MKFWRTTSVGGFVCLVVLLALAPVGLSLMGERHPFELMTHFRPHYLAASVACLVVLGAMRAWRWAAVALVVTAVHAWAIVPWWFGGGDEAASGPALKLLIANVNSRNRHDDRVLALIEKERPDVFVMLESSPWWAQAMTPIHDDYPHVIGRPREDNFGIALYSKLPMPEKRIEMLALGGLPSIVATLELEGRAVGLVATHPYPPVDGKHAESRDRQLRAAADVAAGVEGPSVLAGDLNVTMWSPVYQRTVGDIDFTNTRSGFGVLATWPTRFGPMGIPIDHCLVSAHFAVTGCRVGPDIGSDHRPMIVELRLRTGGAP